MPEWESVATHLWHRCCTGMKYSAATHLWQRCCAGMKESAATHLSCAIWKNFKKEVGLRVIVFLHFIYEIYDFFINFLCKTVHFFLYYLWVNLLSANYDRLCYQYITSKSWCDFHINSNNNPIAVFSYIFYNLYLKICLFIYFG